MSKWTAADVAALIKTKEPENRTVKSTARHSPIKPPVMPAKGSKLRIGIDPDLEASGICLIEHSPFKKQVVLSTKTADFFECLLFIKSHPGVLVCIESGWENAKSNFRQKFFSKKSGQMEDFSDGQKEKMAKNVGENQAIGKLFMMYCEKYKIPYKLYRPQSAKWDADMFKKVTGFEGRTNQECRDAVRAAWL